MMRKSAAVVLLLALTILAGPVPSQATPAAPPPAARVVTTQVPQAATGVDQPWPRVLTFTPPQVVARPTGRPADVACPTSTWCLAVDNSGVARAWSSGGWQAPRRIIALERRDVLRVSCLAAGHCVVVAKDIGQVAVLRSGSWTVRSHAAHYALVDCTSTSCMLASDPSGTGLAAAAAVARYSASTGAVRAATGPPTVLRQADDIACASGTCVLSGRDSNGNPVVLRSGATWSRTRIGTGGNGRVLVSCSSTSACSAVSASLSARWDGSTWSRTSATWLSAPQTLSCTSARSCWAVDDMRVRWDGSAWRPVVMSSYSARHGVLDGTTAMIAIDCISTMCMEVDALGYASRWNGTRWSSATRIALDSGGLRALSCGSSTNCVAADDYGNVTHFNGVAWTRTRIAREAVVVRCVGSWCMAVEGRGARFRTASGGTWAPARTLGLPDTVLTPSGLACVDRSFCLLVDGFTGKIHRWNGTSWSAGQQVFSARLTSTVTIECLSRSFCMAVDTARDQWTRWNGSTWSARAAAPAWSYSNLDLACSSSTRCVVVAQSRTHRWVSGRWSLAPRSGMDPPSIECLNTGECTGLWSTHLVTLTAGGWVAAPMVYDPAGSMSGGETGEDFDCVGAGFCVVAAGARASVGRG